MCVCCLKVGIACGLWPSLTWAVEGLLFAPKWVVLGDESHQKWLSPACFGTAISLEDLTQVIGVPTFVLGSPAFMDRVMGVANFKLEVIVVLEGSVWRSFRRQMLERGASLTHSSVSRVTSARLRVYHNGIAGFEPVGKSYSRRLLHGLTCAYRPQQRLVPCPAPSDEEFEQVEWITPSDVQHDGHVLPGELHPGGLTPVHPKHYVYCCPSVFTRTGWTERALSAEEVALAYDMPVAVVKCISHLDSAALPFLGSVPLKLVEAFQDA